MAKKIAEERFTNITNRDNSRKEVFKIAKQMNAKNCNVVGDKCVKNDNEELAVTDAEKHLVWNEH